MGSRYTPASEESPRPTWTIPRGLIVLLTLAAAVISIAGARALSSLLGPLFLALMLTIAVQPIQTWVQRRWASVWGGLLAAVAAAFAILLGLIGALALSVAQLATELPNYTDTFDDLISGVSSWMRSVGIDEDRISSALRSLDIGKLVGYIDQLLAGLLGLVSNLVFILALILFMAIDGSTITRRMSIVDRMRPDISYAFAAFVGGTRKYLIVSTVFGLIVAVFDGAALWLLGVPLPLLWALLSFITNYIPNVGFLIGLVPPAFLALLEGGPVLMLWVIVVYSVINFVIQSIIQPKYVGDAVGLSVTVTFLSLVFWSWVFGALGALLAVPLTLLVKALLIDIDPSARWVDSLISGSSIEDEADDEPDDDDETVTAT